MVVVVIVIVVVVVVVVSGVPKVFMAPRASNHNGHLLTEITNVIKKQPFTEFFLFPSIPLNLLGAELIFFI